MRHLWTIAFKEVTSYFHSPIAYVLVAVFLIINGYIFSNITSVASAQSMQMLRFQGVGAVNVAERAFQITLNNMSVILLFIIPILTMRLLSEEKKTRTAELLLTSPLTISEIVLGKYLGAFMVYLTMLGLTLYMPLLLSILPEQGQVNWGTIFTGYLGLVLLGAVLLSIGLFASSITENQIIAALISFGLLLLVWLLGWAAARVEGTGLGELLSYLSILDHFEGLLRGLIETRTIVYYLSLVAFGLFLTHRVMESQRWK
jgi:ABC-2 type transport system permease protein